MGEKGEEDRDKALMDADMKDKGLSLGGGSPADADDKLDARLTRREGVGDGERRRTSMWMRVVEHLDLRERISAQVQELPRRINEGMVQMPCLKMMTWQQVVGYCVAWVRQPQNLALLLWSLLVGVSGAILFLVMIGALNAQLKEKQRQDLLEACNQALNALFTFMCLITHPERILAAFRLYRWRPDDILKMRKVYCKGGVRKPHEWGHLLVLTILLNLNCLFQYCLAGLNWGFSRLERPPIGVAVCFAGAFGCAAAGGVYASVSPLGRDYSRLDRTESSTDLENPDDSTPTQMDEKVGAKESGQSTGGLRREESTRLGPQTERMLCRRPSFGKSEEKPAWVGGLFSCMDDVRLCWMTMACFFCVFGYNMHRLRFGNAFVQTATFLIFFFSPYLLFILFAVNIRKWDTQVAIGCIGLGMSLLGLTYGGYWRIQIRKTYGLAPHAFCGRKHKFADIFLWFLFPCCSLCQEVRTAEAYNVLDVGLLEKSDGIRRPRCGFSFSKPDEDEERLRDGDDDDDEEELRGENKATKAPTPHAPPARESRPGSISRPGCEVSIPTIEKNKASTSIS